eukprot:1158508-Pelagomonas_calceolata.AAC.15
MGSYTQAQSHQHGSLSLTGQPAWTCPAWAQNTSWNLVALHHDVIHARFAKPNIYPIGTFTQDTMTANIITLYLLFSLLTAVCKQSSTSGSLNPTSAYKLPASSQPAHWSCCSCTSTASVTPHKRHSKCHACPDLSASAKRGHCLTLDTSALSPVDSPPPPESIVVRVHIAQAV